MGIFKRNPFGHILFIKKWIIRIFGIISHGRYRRFNDLQIEGSEIIRDLISIKIISFYLFWLSFTISFYFNTFIIRPVNTSTGSECTITRI